MKKSLILILFALLSSVTYAQFSWNVKAGMSLSNWSEDNDDAINAKFGYKFGVGGEYAFTRMWAVQASLVFTDKGVKNPDLAPKVNIDEQYLQVPIQLAARFNIGNGTNMVISAGPYLAYGIGGKTKLEVNGKVWKVDTFEASQLGVDKEGAPILYPGLERFDAGLIAGVAFEIGKVVAGVEGEYGAKDIIPSEGKFKNTNLSFSIGYKF